MSSATLQLWEYRDTEVAAVPVQPPPEPAPPASLAALPPGLTEAEVAVRIQHALQEAEQRWAAAAEQHEARRREQLEVTLQAFAGDRARYFKQVEAEIVHLALAIARKILDREATLDPDLLAALVRIALDRMGAGPVVKLRLATGELVHWQRTSAFAGSPYHLELAADPSLAPGDCIVETDLGIANFGLDAQFKEIEQGMLDLLRLRPSIQNPKDFVSTPAIDDPATGKSC